MRFVLVVAIACFYVPAPAGAQTPNPSFPLKTWKLDLSGSAGISPGIGESTTGIALTGAVTLVRTTAPDDFRHQCLGLTATFTRTGERDTRDLAGRRELSMMAGPRWDAGDSDGTGFVRLVGGLRRLSNVPARLGTATSVSKTIAGVGIGVGLEVQHVLLDLSWTMSPWEDDSFHRLAFSLGYTWSFPLGR